MLASVIRRYDGLERLLIAFCLGVICLGVAGWIVGVNWIVLVAVALLTFLSVILGVELRRKVRLEHEALRSHLIGMVREMTAAAQLVKRISALAPLPPMDGWALQPSALITLFDLAVKHKPNLIVEFGSGSSTVVLGYAAAEYGGRVVAVEGSEEYASATREMLADHGLSATCSVVVASMMDTEVDGCRVPWYDPSALDMCSEVGLLIVDGPPASTGPMAREPALPFMRGRLLPGSFVVLDDADRDDERQILDRWEAKFPELERVRSSAPRIAIRRVP